MLVPYPQAALRRLRHSAFHRDERNMNGGDMEILSGASPERAEPHGPSHQQPTAPQRGPESDGHDPIWNLWATISIPEHHVKYLGRKFYSAWCPENTCDWDVCIFTRSETAHLLRGPTHRGDAKRSDSNTASAHVVQSNRPQRNIEASREPRTAICTAPNAFSEERSRATPDLVQHNENSQRRTISRPPSTVASFDQRPSRVPVSTAVWLPTPEESMVHDMMTGTASRLGQVSMHYHPLQIPEGTREFQQFTQRIQDSGATKPTKKGFHIAFHGQPASEHARSTVNASSQETPLTDNRSAVATGNKSVRTPWREVGESIDHIYEDPSVDFVQMRLLHNSGEKDKRQKCLEHKRLLAAAAQLQQEKEEKLRQHDE
ncbi:hypothetical protein FI667_g1660, partial [Globisporangium splendens]